MSNTSSLAEAFLSITVIYTQCWSVSSTLSVEPEARMLSVFAAANLSAWNMCRALPSSQLVNTLRPRQNGRHFADDTFKRIFLNKNVWISIKISLKLVPKDPINKIPALFQIMAWRRPGDKPLSEAMLVSLLTQKCVTQPQWVNPSRTGSFYIDGLMQERCSSSVLAMELRLSCINL